MERYEESQHPPRAPSPILLGLRLLYFQVKPQRRAAGCSSRSRFRHQSTCLDITSTPSSLSAAPSRCRPSTRCSSSGAYHESPRRQPTSSGAASVSRASYSPRSAPNFDALRLVARALLQDEGLALPGPGRGRDGIASAALASSAGSLALVTPA